MIRRPPRSALIPYTTRFRSLERLHIQPLGYTASLKPPESPKDCSSLPLGLHSNQANPLPWRSDEHTSALQSRQYLVCRLLLENKYKLHSHNYIVFHLLLSLL